MAIYKLIAKGSFGPDEIEAMSAAYERALLGINLIDRNDALTEMIAASIVAVAATGESDPQILMERALQALGEHTGETKDGPSAHRLPSVSPISGQ
jgi:hypothetical protein